MCVCVCVYVFEHKPATRLTEGGHIVSLERKNAFTRQVLPPHNALLSLPIPASQRDRARESAQQRTGARERIGTQTQARARAGEIEDAQESDTARETKEKRDQGDKEME